MRVAVVGFGRMGEIHAATLAQDGRVDEIVIVETDSSRLAQARLQGYFTHSPDLVAAIDGGLDAAIVATPAPTHIDVVSALLGASVPTLCEKPLALTVQDIRTLQALSAKTPLQVGFQRRFDPAYGALVEKCAARRLDGEQATLFRLASGDATPPSNGFLESAGSIFHDMLIHDIDVLRLLTPSPVASVSAHGSRLGLPPRSGLGTAVVALSLADGAEAVISGSRACGSYDTSAAVTFPSGVVTLGRASERCAPDHVDAPARAESRWRGFEDRFAAAYALEVKAFLNIAANGGTTSPGPADASAALAIADAAAEAVERGCRVAVSY